MTADDNGDSEELPPEVQFEVDFYRGVLTFVTIANVIRGHHRIPAEDVVKKMLDPIVGNRNKSNITLAEVMPDLYKKVIDYCGQSLSISDAINEEMEH